MADILLSIEDEIKKITQIIEHINKSIIRPGKKSFAVKKRDRKRYYYFYESRGGKSRRRYLGDEGSEKFKTAFGSSYNATLLEILQKNLDLLRTFKKRFLQYSPSNVKAKMSPCVRGLTAPSFFIDGINELFEWANSDYPINTREFGKQKIYAKDGRRVRSKSECIIYNLLLDAGIPFRYDPIMSFVDPLGDICNKSPDFLFKCLDGSYIILEHAGMLSQRDYAENFAEKLRIYSANGYELNVNLFLTSDYTDGGINSVALQTVIDIISRRVFQL